MPRKTSIKLADDATFEQNFFQLAFAYVRDKIPNLMDYMLGFEVVNKNDDGTQAVGLFRFDVNGRSLYVPVFYKNGELKGSELLYNQDQNSFVPNRENWVDSLLNTNPAELGAPADLGRGEIMRGFNGGSDLSKIYNPTMNTKLGMDRMLDLPDFPALSFLSFVKQADCCFARKYLNTLMANPELHKLAVDMYGAELYDSLDGCKEADNILLDTEKKVDVEVIDACCEQDVLDTLSESEKKDLLFEGVVVRDNRDNGPRIPYKMQAPMAFNVCDCAGVYDVLVRGGDLMKGAVIPCMRLCKTPGTDSSLGHGPNFGSTPQSTVQFFFPLEGSKAPVKAPSTEMFTLGTLGDKDAFQKFLNGLKPAGEAQVNASYPYPSDSKTKRTIFIEADGSQAIGPIKLSPGVSSGGSKTYKADGCWDLDIEEVVVSPAHRRIKIVDRVLYVPETAKAKSYKHDYGDPELRLGTARDIDHKILHSYDEVKVACSPMGYTARLNDKVAFSQLSKKDAYVSLVRDIGLSTSDAKDMLTKAAALENPSARFEKQAQPFFAPGIVATPDIPPVPMGVNPVLGVPEQYPQAQTMNASTGQPGNIQNQMIMNSLTGMGQGGGLPQESVDAIMQAAQSGDRDVFDVANISELINRTDIDTPLDQYMADLSTALDRLGRIYFLILFHGDKFAERFSQEDLPSMEESIRTVFLNLGELILKLKERKIQSDAGSAVETDLNQMI
jgi:hypothetical protein